MAELTRHRLASFSIESTLNLGDNGLGIKNDGHFKTSTYEISHPLNTDAEVKNFVNYLQQKEGGMWQVILLAFSLMYIVEKK